jgi:folate-binding protein YgfZ
MVLNSFEKNTKINNSSVIEKEPPFDWVKGFEFAPAEEQFVSLTKGAGLRKISGEGITEVKGSDALDYLHRISTNSIKNLEKNFFARTTFTTEKGRIIDSVGILNFGEFLLLAGSGFNQNKVAGWIRKYIIQDDVKVVNYDGRFIFFELSGPQADSFIRLIVGNEINKIEVNQFKEYFVEEMDIFILKLKDFNGNLKYWIFASPVYAQKMVSYMLENRGVFDFNLISDEVYNAFRIDAGISDAPGELNDQFNPLEVNLTGELCGKKGCYVGQEVLARLDTYDKVQRVVLKAAFDAAPDERGRYILYDMNTVPVGEITSKAMHPVSKKYIGLAVIKKNSLNAGDIVNAKSEFGSVNVELIKLNNKK